MTQLDKDRIFFTVWLLNNVADARGCSAREVYQALQKANLVNEYVIPLYPVLHTMGREALVDEVEELIAKRGISL